MDGFEASVRRAGSGRPDWKYCLGHLGEPLSGLRAGAGVRHLGRVGGGTGTVFVPSVTLAVVLRQRIDAFSDR